MKRYRVGLAVVVGLIALGYGGWRLLQPVLRPTPEEALRSFYADVFRAEDQRCDPLILCGRRAVPFVMDEVRRGERPLRRYAISFLGNAGDDRAIPLLRSVLQSEAEVDYYRADALLALYQLHPEDGPPLATVYAARADFLGYIAREILEYPERAMPEHRTYLDALVGKHY